MYRDGALAIAMNYMFAISVCVIWISVTSFGLTVAGVGVMSTHFITSMIKKSRNCVEYFPASRVIGSIRLKA